MPIRVAVIGAGTWGASLVRVVAAADGAALTWVCDRDPAALARAHAVAPGARLTERVDDR